MKKILIPALILWVASVASFSAFANTGWVPMSGRAMPRAEIVKALETDNYASLPDDVKAKITETQFQIAREKYLSKTTKKATKQVWKNNDDKKGSMQWQQQGQMKGEKKGMGPMHSEAVEKAIESGDYAAFREAMIAQIPTEADFQKRVAAHKAHMVALTAIQTAIKNNDFTAFQKAHTDMKAAMSEFHTENGITPKTPDVTQIKEHFAEMVAKYKADGTLPEEFGKGGMRKGEGMRK